MEGGGTAVWANSVTGCTIPGCAYNLSGAPGGCTRPGCPLAVAPSAEELAAGAAMVAEGSVWRNTVTGCTIPGCAYNPTNSAGGCSYPGCSLAASSAVGTGGTGGLEGAAPSAGITAADLGASLGEAPAGEAAKSAAMESGTVGTREGKDLLEEEEVGVGSAPVGGG